MRFVNHPSVVACEGVFKDSSHYYCVMEFVEGGELFDRIVSLGGYPEPLAKKLMIQILIMLKHLHEKRFAHRDLKPGSHFHQSLCTP